MHHYSKTIDERKRETGRIVRAIRLIRNVHRRYSQELMKGYRMTGQQTGALHILAHNSGISLGELSERMYLHVSTCSGIVDRLERKGCVTRKRSREDRRVVHLRITARGKAIMRKMPVFGFGMLMRDINKLPAAEIHQISEAMKILMRVMKIEWIEEKEVDYER